MKLGCLLTTRGAQSPPSTRVGTSTAHGDRDGVPMVPHVPSCPRCSTGCVPQTPSAVSLWMQLSFALQGLCPFLSWSCRAGRGLGSGFAPLAADRAATPPLPFTPRHSQYSRNRRQQKVLFLEVKKHPLKSLSPYLYLSFLPGKYLIRHQTEAVFSPPGAGSIRGGGSSSSPLTTGMFVSKNGSFPCRLSPWAFGWRRKCWGSVSPSCTSLHHPLCKGNKTVRTWGVLLHPSPGLNTFSSVPLKLFCCLVHNGSAGKDWEYGVSLSCTHCSGWDG